MSIPVGPYSPIVRAGEFLICSGQIGLADGILVAGGVVAQFRQAVANAEAVLATEGATLADVVKTTVFLVHMDDFSAMNEAYVTCFGDSRPARSAVGVAALPLGALVEIELWAYDASN
ncbi:RidA family protein [Candidatus Poriferisocius sp.]|uniref:RidA family protein n=1 Tax=Candidatus Poriferisocius sp. TaxID=3101276 RepID=UPI003B015C2A